MNMLTVDICIAGRGPAGIIAARQLALAGFSVIILDSASHKIHKFGETLPGAAIRLLLKLGLGAVVEALQPDQQTAGNSSACVGGNIAFWGSHSAVITDGLYDPYGFGLRIDRQKFDALLLQHAFVEGIQHISSNILALNRDHNLWAIYLENNTFISAKWVIDATGRSGKVSRLLDVQRHRGTPLVALYRSFIPKQNSSLNKTIISSNKNGWFYAGKISEQNWVIGYHTIPKIASRLRNDPTHWDEIIRNNTAIAEIFTHLTFGKNVFCHDARSAWLKQGFGEGWIACGDALLAFDPIAGQGLFNAIYTSMKAAEAITQYETDKQTVEHYSTEIHQVIKTYEKRRSALYQQEQRWLNSPFWKAHQTTTYQDKRNG